MNRRALAVLTLLLPAALAGQAAQSTTPPSAAVMQFIRFADVFGSRLVAAFDSIPATKYDYRPTPPQQTVGYIAQHLEGANYSLCERFAELKYSPTSRDSLADTVKARWPKDTLIARLKLSLNFCDSALGRIRSLESPVLVSTLLAFETDLAEHYSQIASYMRLLGLVPPSALKPRARTAIELPASALSRYVGTYELTPGYDLLVSVRDTALFIRSSLGSTPAQLWPQTETDFFARNAEAQVSFVRDASGKVTGLVLHQYGRDRPARKIR